MRGLSESLQSEEGMGETDWCGELELGVFEEDILGQGAGGKIVLAVGLHTGH